MSDKLSHNLAAGALGLVLLVVVAGATLLALYDKTVPDLLQVIGGGAAGSLGTLVAAKQGQT